MQLVFVQLLKRFIADGNLHCILKAKALFHIQEKQALALNWPKKDPNRTENSLPAAAALKKKKKDQKQKSKIEK